jgi:hypothetical protein
MKPSPLVRPESVGQVHQSEAITSIVSQVEASPRVPHGVVRADFDLSFYTDRAANRYGGLFHSWGPLRGGEQNTRCDGVMLTVQWWRTHLGPGVADFQSIHAQIERCARAGKKVYLYPHPAFPPRWTGLSPIEPRSGWIDYFEPVAHRLQCEWQALIAREFGRDERVCAIRMSAFEHGEAWVHGARLERLRARAAAAGMDIAAYARPFLTGIYEAMLAEADPFRLVAHGGGLQGDVLAMAVARGTGHGNGTSLLDFAGSHQFPRPDDVEFSDGHLRRMAPLNARGSRALYFVEEQNGETWDHLPGDGHAFMRRMLASCALCVTHGVNYIFGAEMDFNEQSYERLSPHGYVSPDLTGRLTRRQEESAPAWRHSPRVTELFQWTRTLLATTPANTPEAFVQLSRHYSADRGCWLEAVEHAMWLDDAATPGVPVEEYDQAVISIFQQEILGRRLSTFARRTDLAGGKPALEFELHPEFVAELATREGELLEVRATYLENHAGRFAVEHATAGGRWVSAGEAQLRYSGEYRTACFLLVDPEIRPGKGLRLRLRSTGAHDVSFALVRVLKA